MKTTNSQGRVICDSVVENGNKIWMTDLHKNGLMEVDKETHCANVLTFFENEAFFAEELFNVVGIVDNKLILTPRAASSIGIYDLLTRKMTYIPLKLDVLEKGWYYKENFKFMFSLSYGKYVYLTGYGYPAIIKLNVDTMEITYLTQWIQEIENNRTLLDKGYLGKGIVLGNIAYIPLQCTNMVIELNMETSEIVAKYINAPVKGFFWMAYDGEKFLLSQRGKNSEIVICWNHETDEISEWKIFDNIDREEALFQIMVFESEIYFVPYCSTFQHVYIYDRVLKGTKLCNELEYLFCDENAKKIGIRLVNAYESGMRFSTYGDNVWHEFDCETHVSFDYEVRVDFKEYLPELKRVFNQECCTKILTEEKLPLKDYILCIASDAGNRKG